MECDSFDLVLIISRSLFGRFKPSLSLLQSELIDYYEDDLFTKHFKSLNYYVLILTLQKFIIPITADYPLLSLLRLGFSQQVYPHTLTLIQLNPPLLLLLLFAQVLFLYSHTNSCVNLRCISITRSG